VIADDHKLIREGLKHILGSVNDMQMVSEEADGFEALTQVCLRGFDLLLLDLSMPGAAASN